MNGPVVCVPTEKAVCAVCGEWKQTFAQDRDLGRVCQECLPPLIDADSMLRIISLVQF